MAPAQEPEGYPPSRIDALVREAIFEPDADRLIAARATVARAAAASGVWRASIRRLYEARGRGELGGFTVPAINLRGLTYDLARAAFRVALRGDAAAMIFELARSEVDYTMQRPAEYATCVLAAALREGYRGPVFLQGDHYRIDARRFADPRLRGVELEALRELILEALACGTYNLDIDSSTLVALSRSSLDEQQRDNYQLCSHLTELIRLSQPASVEVSIGGEIGEVGGPLSTVGELVAFMEGYERSLAPGYAGLSKLSVQSGTRHGGVAGPDGKPLEMTVDFEALRELSRIAREVYGLAGVVQHGASTLPARVFHHFPEAEVAEVHLATNLQNLVFDHPAFPRELRERMARWCHERRGGERREGETDEQFFYETRKRAWGAFKRELWDLDVKDELAAAVEEELERLWRSLGVTGTRATVARYIAPPPAAEQTEPRPPV